jgi:hypothetical protein
MKGKIAVDVGGPKRKSSILNGLDWSSKGNPTLLDSCRAGSLGTSIFYVDFYIRIIVQLFCVKSCSRCEG